MFRGIFASLALLSVLSAFTTTAVPAGPAGSLQAREDVQNIVYVTDADTFWYGHFVLLCILKKTHHRFYLV